MSGKNDGYPYYFLFLYALNYMAMAVYTTFIPIFLNKVGFSSSMTGALLSIGPLVAITAQAAWGIAGDRAKTKNLILRVLLAGSALSILFFPMNTTFQYMALVISVFTFFQSSINPISDAITLEYLETTKWKFAPIRMAGTAGYALMAVLAGIIARQNINNIFIVYFAIAVISFFWTFTLPQVKGHQSYGKKVAVWELLKNKELMLLVLFSLFVHISLGYYYSFFAIYYREMGADNVLLGWAMFISGASEIPFLLYADRILERVGIKYTLLGSAIVIATRWLLLHHVANVYTILPMMLMHGLSYIVFNFSMATYINKEVPKELKATGQALIWLVGMGIARIIGSALGGVLNDTYGIKQVFLFDSIFLYTAIIAFGAIFIIRRPKRIH